MRASSRSIRHPSLQRVCAWLLVVALVPALQAGEPMPLPEGFVYADTLIPGLRVDLRYRGSDNFLGVPVDGYRGERLILTREAAVALAKVQEALQPMGLGLLVYDGYRPQRAVDHFVRWATDPEDQQNKAAYYPDVDKSRLIAGGYIAERSGHSRGSTVDLTLVELASGAPLDMGTPWDYFGPESWPSFEGITDEQQANRQLLRVQMLQQGFRPLPEEWWHFTLEGEPFPDAYFDFPVE
jgi:D-alanyl-D-alanine dipeptidase